jgi:hypothetical protein
MHSGDCYAHRVMIRGGDVRASSGSSSNGVCNTSSGELGVGIGGSSSSASGSKFNSKLGW